MSTKFWLLPTISSWKVRNDIVLIKFGGYMVLVVAYYTPLSVTVPNKCDESLARQDCLAILGPLVASLWPCCLSILISALSDEQTILIGLQQLGRPVL